MTALAASLARFARELRKADIGAHAAEHADALILDAMGCALAGWAAEETPQVLRTARGLGGDGQATIVGDGPPASLLGAVLANAYLTTAITACDVYIPSHCHLTPEVVPAALAVAEAEHASGEEFRTAVVAGLEVASRLLRAIDYTEFRARGWHSPGVIGPVGAAVAAGRLLGLDADGLRTAMSLAVSQAAGTFAAWPTTAVKFHQARGAAAGLLAALLVSSQELPAAADLTRVEIRVPPRTYRAHRDLVHPAGTFEALLSFHYVAAATIVYGRFDIDLTGPAQRDDPEITKFIDQRVDFLPDPTVPRGGVEVVLTARDGGVVAIRQDHALGTPQRPATPAQVQRKFLRCASSRVGPAGAGELLGQLSHLDQVADCAGLLRLLRSGAA